MVAHHQHHQLGMATSKYFQLFLVCASIVPSMSFINLFLGKGETFLLLGLKNTNLYYIQDGKINDYALGFQVPVAPNISALHFTWQNKDPRIEIPYSISLSLTDVNAIEPPMINISREGKIPHELQVFRILLPCTGLSNAEVDVNIYFNLTMPINNFTSLTLKRKKICLQGLKPSHEYKISSSKTTATSDGGSDDDKGEDDDEESVDPTAVGSGELSKTSQHQSSSIVNSVVVPSIVDNVAGGGSITRISSIQGFESRAGSKSTPTVIEDLTEKKSKDESNILSPSTTRTEPSSSHSIYIIVGTISLFTFACILCFVKSYKKSRDLVNPNFDYGSHLTGIKDGVYPHMNTMSSHHSHGFYSENKRTLHHPGSAASYMSLPRSTVHIYCEPTSNRLEDQLIEISIDRRNILIQEKLNDAGTFSQVFKGVMIQNQNDIDVQIKTVNSEQCSKMQVSLFVAEGMAFYKLIHPNILPVIAACIQEPERPLLMYPLTTPGNLKNYLRTYKCSPDQDILRTQDLVDMAIQIVSGMIFLHSKTRLHRDLSTRNCVIHKSNLENTFVIKITDNSLSRDMFPDDYHCLGDCENRPIKWLSLESLVRKEFTPSSDVWSFGVTLWELMTLGQQPYFEVDPFEMAAYLQDGYRLFQPINCPDKLYDAMVCCWNENPDSRPNFVELLHYLQDFHTALGPYI